MQGIPKIFFFTVLIILVSSFVVSAQDIAPNPDHIPFSLSSWIRYKLKMDTFSVVGDSRGCDRQVTKAITISGGDSLSRSASQYCSSGHGLWDVFLNNYGKSWREYKDDVNVFCSVSNNNCIFELYCCDKDECKSSSDCYGGECKKFPLCTLWRDGGYKCTGMGGILEQKIPYYTDRYAYCTSTPAQQIDCWYYDGTGSTCTKRTYIDDECPSSYASRTLYNSKSKCEDNIQKSCEGKGYLPCSSSGTLICVGNDVHKCKSVSGASGLCWVKEKTCQYGCSEGVCKSAPSKVGDIRITEFDFPKKAGSWLIWRYGDEIKITVKNFGNTEDSIFLESGYYTKEYATGVALLYSIGTFTVVPYPNCNPVETFLHTKKITLNAGESETIKLNPKPTNVFMLYNTGTYNIEDTEIVVFAGLYEECLSGYTNDAGTTGKGVMYDYDTYILGKGYVCPSGLPFQLVASDGTIVGKCEKNVLKITEKIDIPSTVLIQAGNVSKCQRNADCPEGLVCEEGYCVGKYVDESARQIGIKASLISGMTAEDLLASSCTQTVQCQTGSYCKSLNYLVDKGYLTDSQSKKLIDRSAVILGSAGGIAGCLVGVSALAPVTAGASAILFPVCALGGVGGVAVGLGIDDIFNFFTKKDLTKSGYCIIEGEGEGKFTDFLRKLAIFKITGDKTTDGAIIGVGGLLLFVIIFSRLAGFYINLDNKNEIFK